MHKSAGCTAALACAQLCASCRVGVLPLCACCCSAATAAVSGTCTCSAALPGCSMLRSACAAGRVSSAQATHLCTADRTRDDELRVHSCFEHFAAVSAQHPQNGQRRAHTSASTVREWSIRVAQQADCRMSSTLFVPHLATICWVLLNKCSTTMQHASCLDAFCFPSEAAHWQPRPL